MTKRTKKEQPPVPGIVSQYESFMKPWERHVQAEPSCFNGDVRIHRYRVTVELIDEPVDEIRARIIRLWRVSDNHHHRQPLRAAAEMYGVELDSSDFGIDRPKRSAQ